MDNVRHHFLKTRGHETSLLRPFKRLLVDIIVSEALLDDTLDLANQFFLKLTSRGHRVAIPAPDAGARRMEVDEREHPKPTRWRSQVWVPDRPTVVCIDDVPFGITFYELTEEAEMVYVNGDYLAVSTLTSAQRLRYKGPHHWTTKRDHASGRRCLQVYSPHFRFKWSRQWRENTPGELSKLISDAVRELEAAVPELRLGIQEAEVQAAEDQRKRDAEWAAYEERARQAKLAKDRQEARTELMAAIASWDEARRITDFFDAAQQRAELLEANQRELVSERVALARALVGEPDPLMVLTRWRAPAER